MAQISLPQVDLPTARNADQPLPADFIRTLSSTIEGEIRLDFHNRMLYATDASLYQVEPLGVVIPANIPDGMRAVRTCFEHNIAMLPRGGGTSLAGQCTNQAIVIDWSNRCRAYSDLNINDKTINVEPGITIDDLNDAIASSGLFFAPDPATARHASIGGCIGNNAAGARSIKYGRTSESIVAIDACLADGSQVRFEHGAGRRDAKALQLAQGVCNIVRAHETLIRERFPKTVRRNAGYGLDMILRQLDAGVAVEDINLAPLLCGSEGTLAITLGATLKLHDRPKSKALAVLGFADLDEAIAAVVPILSTQPSAVEMLDDIIIDLAKANNEYRKYVDLMPAPPHGQPLKAVLYVEYFGVSNQDIDDRIAALRKVIAAFETDSSRSRSIVVPMHVHKDAGAMLNAWKLRKAGEPLLHGIPGTRKPITFIEDNAIPVERLGEFVKRLRAIVTAHNTIASYWAHASVGVLHVRPLIDIHDTADREKMISIATQTADLARELGGVMSGEHGDGRVRSPFLERYYGPELMDAFKQIKRLFDPHNLLNPGNIVDITGDNPRPIPSIAESLRVEPKPKRPLAWPRDIETSTFFDYSDQHGFDSAVEMCNGSGVCRKQQGGTMCPSYQATLDERHSTRGRGNALRLAITGQLGVSTQSIWNDPGTKETLHLCLSCKACKTECPSNVDIARLKAEYTAQRYRESGTPLAAKIMGEIRMLNRLGAIAPAIANWMSTTGLARAIVNRVLDIHPQRSLPKFSEALDHAWPLRRPSATAVLQDKTTPPNTTRPSRRDGVQTIALFGDCFTMYNESHIGLATKRVFEAFGYNIVLANAGCCGRAKISLGLLAEAIHDIDDTLERLTPLIESDQVAAIVVAEPSCLSAFKDDWLNLKLRTPLTLRKKLAAKSFLPEQFLHVNWDKHPTTPRFNSPQSPVLLHGHCHQKALWGASSSADMLRRVAGDKLRVLDTGCCGMAGSFGYTTDRYELSIKIGDLALLPEARKADAATSICAPGTSCRHQIHDGAAKHAKHPMELLDEWLIG
ncbi:MAG: FAD-linked oxidase C-terminal domain-containing protein [Phycisphaerales bacterium]